MATKKITSILFLSLALCIIAGCIRSVQYNKEMDAQEDSTNTEGEGIIDAIFLFPNHLEPDSVVISLFAYSEKYSVVELDLSKSSHDFIRFLPTWEVTHAIIMDQDIDINNALIDSIFELGDLLFVKKTVPVYSYRERSDSVGPFHEGPILSVLRYTNGINTNKENIYLEDAFKSIIQYTEDSYAIVYSRQFRFFIQALKYAQAIASGEKEEYEEHLERLQRDSDYYPGLEILVPLK